MTKPFNDNLSRVIKLTQEMLALADEGDRDRNDDSCGIVYGILRDSAYRLRKLANDECGKHKDNGKWDEFESGGACSTDWKTRGKGVKATVDGRAEYLAKQVGSK